MAQLLKHYDDLTDRDLKQMRFPAYVQKKEDGVYAEVGVAGTYSRQERAFYIPVEVQNQIRIPNYHLVAELICPGLSLEELSGLVNPNRTKPWKDYQIDHFHEHARYVYHDMISSTAVLRGFDTLPYKNRLEALHNAVSSTDIVQTSTINSFNEVDEYYETAVQLGWEGIVLKQMHGIWQSESRNFDQVKRVRGIDVDLVCNEVVQGKGKFAGYIAKLGFTYKGKKFYAGAGAGWNMDALADLTSNWRADPSSIIGTTWRVHGLQESSKGVIRLPKFCEQRIDK